MTNSESYISRFWLLRKISAKNSEENSREHSSEEVIRKLAVKVKKKQNVTPTSNEVDWAQQNK